MSSRKISLIIITLISKASAQEHAENGGGNLTIGNEAWPYLYNLVLTTIPDDSVLDRA